MLRRLLLLLLLFGLATPAVAMTGHCASVTATASAHHDCHGAKKPRPDAPARASMADCLGCVTPWHEPALAPAVPALVAPAPQGWSPRALVALLAVPETPPPRS